MEQFKLQDWMVDQIYEIRADICDVDEKSQAQMVHLGRLLSKNYQLQERRLEGLRVLCLLIVAVQIVSMIFVFLA